MAAKSLLPFLWLLGSLAWAQSTPEQLVRSLSRPTAREVLDAHHPLLKLTTSFLDSSEKESYRKLARTIVLSEKTFPNLTYAVLGRDSALFGDLVDAFYLSQGQPGRVVRLNGSGPTIRKTSFFDLFVFLRQNGLRPSGEGLARPYVIFDRTDFTASSQARRLMQAAMKGLLWTGAKIEVLEKQMGVVRSSQDSQIEKMPLFDSLGPQVASSLPFADFTDQSFWNDSFGNLLTDKNGLKVPSPPKSYPSFHREKVLASLFEGLRLVRSAEFLEMVRDEAKKEKLDLSWLRRSSPRPVTSFYDLPLNSFQTPLEKVQILQFLSWAQVPDRERWDLLEKVQFSDSEILENLKTLRVATGEAETPEFGFTAAQVYAAFELLAEITQQGKATSETQEILKKIILEKADLLFMMGSSAKTRPSNFIVMTTRKLLFNLRTESHQAVATEIFKEFGEPKTSVNRWDQIRRHFKNWKDSTLDKLAKSHRSHQMNLGTGKATAVKVTGSTVAGFGATIFSITHGISPDPAAAIGLATVFFKFFALEWSHVKITKYASDRSVEKKDQNSVESQIFDAMMIDLTDPEFENFYLRRGGEKNSCVMSLKT